MSRGHGPGSLTMSQNDMTNVYYAQKALVFPGNFANYATGTYQERVGKACTTERPDLVPSTVGGHLVACHLSPQQRRDIWTDEITPRLA